MENKIDKAKKMVKDYLDTTDGLVNPYDVPEVMIEFAKLHVEAALKAAHNNMQLPQEDLEFTLGSYPLTNIK